MAGLHAYGTFADIEVSLLSENEELWELQVVAGRTTMQFPIPSPEMTLQILEFLQTHLGLTKSRVAKPGEHPGVKAGTPIYYMVGELAINESVTLRKDGESSGRFIFSMCEDSYGVFFDLRQAEVEQLIEALRDLCDDWQLVCQP